MSAKISTLMPRSSGTASATRRTPYWIISYWGERAPLLPQAPPPPSSARARPSRPGSAYPGVLEAQLERGQRRRALHVGLHPVALQLVAEDDQRAFLLEPAHQLRVHLLARGRVRGEAEGVEPLVRLLRLEPAEVPGRGGVLHRVVEHVRIHRDAPPAARDVELLADQLLEALPGLEPPHLHHDPHLLELLAEDLAGLDQHRHLRLHAIGEGEAVAVARLREELLGLRELGAALVGVDPGSPRARRGGRLGGDHVSGEVNNL